LIEWTIKGYAGDMMERFKQKKPEPGEFQRLWDEFDQYLRILKTCFYKREGEEG